MQRPRYNKKSMQMSGYPGWASLKPKNLKEEKTR